MWFASDNWLGLNYSSSKAKNAIFTKLNVSFGLAPHFGFMVLKMQIILNKFVSFLVCTFFFSYLIFVSSLVKTLVRKLFIFSYIKLVQCFCKKKRLEKRNMFNKQGSTYTMNAWNQQIYLFILHCMVWFSPTRSSSRDVRTYV